MNTLVLELKADDMMIINGAPLRVRNRTRMELTAKARFLFGKQIMPPADADSPARRIYYRHADRLYRHRRGARDRPPPGA